MTDGTLNIGTVPPPTTIPPPTTTTLMWAILAHIYQPKALKEYGNTGDASIRAVLEHDDARPELKAHYQIVSDYAKALIGDGLTPEDKKQVDKFIDTLPAQIRDFLVEKLHRFRLFPPDEEASIVTALTEMLKEASHADDSRDSEHQEEADSATG